MSMIELVHKDDLIAWNMAACEVDHTARSAVACRSSPALVAGAGRTAERCEAGEGAGDEASSAMKVAPSAAEAMAISAVGESGAAPTTMDYRMRRRDGSWVWVETVLMAAGGHGYVRSTDDHEPREWVLHGMIVAHVVPPSKFRLVIVVPFGAGVCYARDFTA